MEEEKQNRSAPESRTAVKYGVFLALLFNIGLLAYAMTERIVQGNRNGASLFGLGIVLLAAVLLLLKGRVFGPLERLAAFLRSEGRKGEPRGLAGIAAELWELTRDKLTRADEELKQSAGRAKNRAVWEARHHTLTEIASYSPAEQLEDYPTGSYFNLKGKVWPGRSCQLYDAFYADQGLLCVLLCQSDGSGAANAMRLSFVAGGIRSQMRRGRTLEESVREAHAFCEAQNRPIRLTALTLNLMSGVTELLSAGTGDPALIRFEENSSWCDIDNGEPLGWGEDRLFHPNRIRMRSGDTLVLYLEESTDFTEGRLREVLNRCLSGKLRVTPEDIVEQIGAAREKLTDGEAYTAVALQFIKPERDAFACVVPAEPSAYPTVLDYMKKQAAEYGLSRRTAAFMAVASEELFLICCRAAEEKHELKVLCSIAEDAGSVVLRIEGDFHGQDPLSQEDADRSGAVSFIRAQTDYQHFQEQNGHDVILIVYFPKDEQNDPERGSGT